MFTAYKSALWVLAAIALSISACSKRLEKINPNSVPETNFYQNEAQALIGLNGVFDAYQRGYTTVNWYRQTDRLTDNATTINNTDGWLDMQNSGHSPVTAALNNYWGAFYTIVNRANYVIDKVNAMSADMISEASKKRIVAEASFLRDWIYLDLVMHWNDVPLYTRANGPFDQGAARSTRQEIFTYMINDLKTNVIPSLPATVSGASRGRIVADAARFLLGKYYLYDEKWSDAAETLKQIIDGGRWALYPDFQKLFTLEGEFSSENLWEIVYETGGVDNGENFSVQIDTLINPIVPNATGRPIDDLADSYLNSDGKPWHRK